MAIRTDAQGDWLSLVTTLPANFSILGWFKMSADTDDPVGVFGFAKGDPGSFANAAYVGMTSDGTGLVLHPGGTDQSFGISASVGTWCFGGLTQVFSTPWAMTAYMANSPTGTLATLSTNNGDGDPAGFNRFLVSNSSIPGESFTSPWFNGVVGPFYIYDSILTQAEFELQRSRILPIKTPWCWVPGIVPGTGGRNQDWSGNGRHFTEAGTLADEDGAPVSWGAPPIVIPSAAAAAPVYAQTAYRFYADDGTSL